MQVGGVPKSITKCESTAELYEATKASWLSDEHFQILGGGSNTVFADDVSGLNVILVANLGREIVFEDDHKAIVRVQYTEASLNGLSELLNCQFVQS